MVLNLYIYLDEGTYPHTHTSISLILVQISHRSYRAYAYTEVPLGTTRLILIPQGLYLYYGVYTCSEVPIGTTEILRNVYWYCETHSYTEVLVSTTCSNVLKDTYLSLYQTYI